jgi:hypothetical protein
MARSTFTAQYHGECESCTLRIEPGDEVEYTVGHTLVHVDCTHPPADEAPLDICPRCFQARAKNSTCGGCD